MKEWQTASEEAHSLIVDWWDKSQAGSWGIPYRNEHTIKTSDVTVLENRPFTLVCEWSVYLLLGILAAKNACFTKKLFLPFNHKKLIRMCHEFQCYLSRADNAHFLVFTAPKYSHSLVVMQTQLEVSATVDRKEALQGFKVQRKVNKLFGCQVRD